MIRLNCICPWRSLLALGYENAVSIERGPLVYALKMEEIGKEEFRIVGMVLINYQVTSSDPWNYGVGGFVP